MTIPFDRGLHGHSDADVLMHAVTDALLGALALGDIGEWFPNSDPQWAGADSAVFLKAAIEEVRRRGWEIAIWMQRFMRSDPSFRPTNRRLLTISQTCSGSPANRST